ncbi:MAG: site-specific integrase [Dehalococcoidia bacterium]|nr:site-specific integrase [Dehalococcoidia bacterium]
MKGPKRNAQARLAQLLVELESGVYVKARKDLTVASYLHEWLNGYVAVNCAPRTQESYHFIAEKHIIPAIGNVHLVALEPRQLQALYAKKRASGLGTRTVRYIYGLMSQALTHAVKQGVLSRNVAQATDPPRLEHKGINTLAREDVDKFFEVAKDSPYYELFYLLLHTGLRRGEALALRWKHVDFGIHSLGVTAYISVSESLSKVEGKVLIKEPKTASGKRRVALSPSCALVLRQHHEEQKILRESLGGTIADGDFVFSKPEGGTLDPSTVSKAFSSVVEKAGLPHMSLHDLRHSHATMLLQAGTHPKIVSERLGHSSVRVTLDTYTHYVAGLQEAAALKFDELLMSGPRVDRNVVEMLSVGNLGGDESV